MRLFLRGAKRLTSAARTIRQPERTRKVQGEAEPNHCCARRSGAGWARGSRVAGSSGTRGRDPPALSEVVDVVELADLEVILAERGDLLLDLRYHRRLRVVGGD